MFYLPCVFIPFLWKNTFIHYNLIDSPLLFTKFRGFRYQRLIKKHASKQIQIHGEHKVNYFYKYFCFYVLGITVYVKPKSFVRKSWERLRRNKQSFF